MDRCETPIELSDLDPLIDAVRAGRYDAVAVCFLHAYRNPVHEVAVGEYLAKALPDFSVTLSHRVSQEWREFARTSTTVMEAYIAPVMHGYLSTLMGELKGALGGRDLHIMQSNGGAMTAAARACIRSRRFSPGRSAGTSAPKRSRRR